MSSITLVSSNIMFTLQGVSYTLIPSCRILMVVCHIWNYSFFRF